MNAAPVARPPSLSGRQWVEIARSESDAFVAVLDRLVERLWAAPTDCEGWTVKDVASHVLGWAEFFTSLEEFPRQIRGTLARRKDFGNLLDAQNQEQVEDRRFLAPEAILQRLKERMPRLCRVRARLAGVGRVVPLYYPPVGTATVAYLMNQIFTRDHFMHRIDITRAAGHPVDVNVADTVVVADLVTDWIRRRRVDARVALTGRAGGEFVGGRGERAVITGDAIEFCRVLSGRAGPDVLELSGDRTAAQTWLAAGCPF